MPQPLAPTPIKHCLLCSKKMERKRRPSGTLEALLHFNKRIFCNRKCMGAWQEGRIKRMSAKNSRRQSVKLRQECCERCGDVKMLAVHHRDSNPTNNDPANLMTLCARCHMQKHWQEWKETTRPSKPCSVCGEPARKRGMCQKHFQRWKKYGDPCLTKKNTASGWVLVRDVF